jgi:hypothetical protein
MKSEDVMKINKVTRVMYDNPEYLLSNGMRALRRLFAETSEEYTSIFTKMQDYLLKVMDDVKVKGWISYNGAINELSYVKGLSKKVNNSYDLAKILMNNMKSDYCKDKGIEWWRKVVVDGIKLMGNLYSNEKEWMIKDGIFNIPSNSRIVVVESEYYKKEWQKRNGEDKFASRMANSTAVSNYDQFLHLIEKLKSKWGERVSIVSEKWVNDNKLKLIKSGR